MNGIKRMAQDDTDKVTSFLATVVMESLDMDDRDGKREDIVYAAAYGAAEYMVNLALRAAYSAADNVARTM